MTYTAVHKVLEGDPELTGRYAALAPRFQAMRELALLLNRKRHRRGSIDFDLREAEVVIVDLTADLEVPQGPKTIGFYPHVDVETRRRAEQAGFDLVVPRSRMAREAAQLVEAV